MPGRRRRARCRRAAFLLDGHKQGADLDLVAFLGVNGHHAPGVRAWQVDDRLVGFELHDGLVGRDDMAFRDGNFDDIGRLDIFAQIGQCEFHGHEIASWNDLMQRERRGSIAAGGSHFAQDLVYPDTIRPRPQGFAGCRTFLFRLGRFWESRRR
ncbi:MAG: hypothetical protein BWZ10_03461 [candidate division BRC1 bacterium ADurb.BinA364]|nr:MAG: hypothetical protein BWZ10_03461 [candidate division BRC1 bacterium ADurb.BinA364]